jgi:hypothetical protein
MLPAKLLYLVVWLVLAYAVSHLAGQRGHSRVAWLLISLLISPLLAFIILLCLPDHAASQQREAAELLQLREAHRRRQAEREAQLAQQRSDPLPPGAEPHFRISLSGAELGSWPLSAIRQQVADGHITLEDYYLDPSTREWLPLACLPELG